MVFKDISDDGVKNYRINSQGNYIFFFYNRNGSISFSIEKEKSKVFIYGLFIGGEQESFDLKVKQIHRSPNAKSKLFIKSLLDNQASLDFDGLIRIEKEASKSIAYQKNTNLLLSKSSHVKTIPSLEILNNDVQCSHGSSTSSVNDVYLEYLQTRGLNLHQARFLMKQAFVRDIFLRINKLLDSESRQETKILEGKILNHIKNEESKNTI